MGLISWLLVGVIAGALAKAITPQKERSGCISSLLIGIAGGVLGGFVARITGLAYMIGNGFIGSIIVATGGAVLMLFLYYRFFAGRKDP